MTIRSIVTQNIIMIMKIMIVIMINETNDRNGKSTHKNTIKNYNHNHDNHNRGTDNK